MKAGSAVSITMKTICIISPFDGCLLCKQAAQVESLSYAACPVSVLVPGSLSYNGLRNISRITACLNTKVPGEVLAERCAKPS
jgi:hypothetical protein